MSTADDPHGGATEVLRRTRLALVGSPNSGKTTLFNALTGLRAKTGNYPGVTVSRYEGAAVIDGAELIVEDLPGSYSLDPISPDEHIVLESLDPSNDRVETPDGLLVTLDTTTLQRSLNLLAQVLQTDLPVCVVLTFSDELTRRQGSLDVAALGRALGVPTLAVTSGRRHDLAALRELLPDPRAWARPALPPPVEPAEVRAWSQSVLAAARYTLPAQDERTRRIDNVLLHPLWGSLVFFAVMFSLFQVIFTVAAPIQDQIDEFFGYLGSQAQEHISNALVGGFIADALFGGVGSVLVFLPQIVLLFVMISLLEGVGYMSRAAFLMDRVMAKAGLEGRAFVALLSSMACAVPGIMATRTLPSARDRLATMMGAPLMTCSARLPVYVLLVGLAVDPNLRWGPVGAQGLTMFGLYVGGALAAMTAAWVFSRLGRSKGPLLPFYMEMPPYRIPSARSVALSVWDASKTFLRKVGKIILVVTVLLWLLLNLPARDNAELRMAGVNTADATAVSAYKIDHSYGAAVGRGVEPVFEPLGFDWRINVGVVASLSAREVFVATLGQVASAEKAEAPQTALKKLKVADGPRAGEPLFTGPVVAALLVFFLFALQCTSTIAVMRRETGSWKWPAIAFSYMFVLAWVMALLARIVVGALS
ncbi:MAG: ferrous iron transporter B [Jatrophihabitans sp.]